MNLSLYSAATGMESQQLNLNTIANNLANVNTPGFKRSKIEFQDLLYQKPTRASGISACAWSTMPSPAPPIRARPRHTILASPRLPCLS